MRLERRLSLRLGTTRRRGRGTHEEDEASGHLVAAELVALAREGKGGLCALLAGPAAAAAEDPAALEAVEGLCERAAVGDEVVALDEPHGEGEEAIVVVDNAEEVARVSLGEDLLPRGSACEPEEGATEVGRRGRRERTERTYRTTGLRRSRSWSVGVCLQVSCSPCGSVERGRRLSHLERRVRRWRGGRGRARVRGLRDAP